MDTAKVVRGSKPAVGLADWARTVPFLLLFAAILLVCDGALRACHYLKLRRLYYKVVWLHSAAMLRLLSLTGTRIRIDRGTANIAGRTTILIVNHQSLFDIILLNALLPESLPRYVSKIELARGLPFVSFNLRHGGHALIDRSDPRQAVGAIEELGRAANAGGLAIAMFPEGTRSRNGSLGAFKPGGLTSLFRCCPQAQVVPILIDGSWKIAAYNLMPIPRKVNVRVIFGPAHPIPESDRHQTFIEELRRWMEEELQKHRSDETAS